jgi:hypothetical protein
MFNGKYSHFVYYLVLIILAPTIILISSLTRHFTPPPNHEYYYSRFLLKSYSGIAALLFFIIGFLAGYFYKLNPWMVGLCLFVMFPLTSILEGTIYKGSHNLIPFEFAVHFMLALPCIIATYLGRFIHKLIEKRRAGKEANKTMLS